MSIRPVYFATLHIICKRNSSTKVWKAFCLEFGDDILGYGDTPENAVTNWEKDLNQKKLLGP